MVGAKNIPSHVAALGLEVEGRQPTERGRLEVKMFYILSLRHLNFLQT